MMSKLGLGLFLAGAVALTACGITDVIGVKARDVVSLIIFYGDTSRISAPDTVNRGSVFDITFETFAGGCTRSVARTDIDVSSNTVRISPFDRSSGGSTCTADLIFLRHTVQARLDVPGVAVIRVVGEQRGGSTGTVNGPAELTRQLIVR